MLGNKSKISALTICNMEDTRLNIITYIVVKCYIQMNFKSMCILFKGSQDIKKDRVRKEVGYRDALHLKPFRGLKYESNVHLRID